jgi:hypothetical protein
MRYVCSVARGDGDAGGAPRQKPVLAAGTEDIWQHTV